MSGEQAPASKHSNLRPLFRFNTIIQIAEEGSTTQSPSGIEEKTRLGVCSVSTGLEMTLYSISLSECSMSQIQLSMCWSDVEIYIII